MGIGDRATRNVRRPREPFQVTWGQAHTTHQRTPFGERHRPVQSGVSCGYCRRHMAQLGNQGDASSYLRRLSELIAEAREVVWNIDGRLAGDEPNPGSVAFNEANNNDELCPDGRPWPPTAVNAAYNLAGILINVSGQYVLALSQLFQDPIALYAFQVVTRSAVEAAARASWLLEPWINPRQRVGRASVERWRAIAERGKVEAAAGRDPSIQSERELEFRAQIAGLGLEEDYDRKKQLKGFEGIVHPGHTDVVTSLLGHLGLSTGEVWYRESSGIAHSAPYSVLDYYEIIQPARPGAEYADIKPKLTVQSLANSALLGAGSFLWAARRHAEAVGWNWQPVEYMWLAIQHEVFGSLPGGSGPT